MDTSLGLRRPVIFASLAMIFALSCAVTQALAQPSTGSPSPTAESHNNPAPGAVEDTLKACLARIPKNATAGQSMLAELGCRRDEQARTSLQTAPQF